jgi:hypothetical protein
VSGAPQVRAIRAAPAQSPHVSMRGEMVSGRKYAQRKNGVPRNRVIFIRPETINIGDVIRARFQVANGLTVDICGKVAKRSYDKQWRVFTTAEGGEIFRWHPEYKPPRITLLARDENPQERLF